MLHDSCFKCTFPCLKIPSISHQVHEMTTYLCLMTGKELQSVWITTLQERYDEREAKELLRLWLEDAHGVSRSSFSLESNYNFQYESDLQRIANGEPIQYVIGEAFFDDLMLKVDGSVLIPRPETEDLVRLLADKVKQGSSVLDIGTGSGAIPLALKNRRQDLQCTTVDVSGEALQIAEVNAEKYDLAISFQHVDILKDWPTGSFDVVVSNPPYIEEFEKSEMSNHVLQHEPHLALFVPDGDPLLFYRTIAEKSKMNSVKSLWFECHINHVDEVATLLKDLGYTSVEKWMDITDRWRFVSGEL